MSVLVVYVTCPSVRSADRVSRELVRERLAACVNQVPLRMSVFRWKGKIERAREILLVIKTRRDALKRLVEKVRELHPYEVPEVIATRVEGGLAAYLDWVRKEVHPGRGGSSR